MFDTLKFVRSIVLCLLVLAGSSTVLRAQAGDQSGLVADGRLDVGFESDFTASLRRLGITQELYYYRWTKKPVGFPAAAGSLDLLTGQGEIQTVGGFHYKEGSMSLQTDLLAIESTSTGIVVTAMIMENGVYLGRYPIYRGVVGVPFQLPLALGAVDSGSFHFALDPEFWSMFTKFFQIPQFVPGPTSGELHFFATLVASSSE